MPFDETQPGDPLHRLNMPLKDPLVRDVSKVKPDW
jgi:hypothetical protein